MPKPICLIRIDMEALRSHSNPPTIPELQEIFKEEWQDYHVLVLPLYLSDQTVELEVFYEKDFTEIQYEELRKYIEEKLT